MAELYRSLTENQIAEFKEAFAVFDKDQNGSISKKELGETLRALGSEPSDAELGDIINAVAQGAEEIHFPQFLGMMAKKQNRGQSGADDEKELRAAYKLFDPKAKGKISKDDIKRVLTTLGEPLTDDEVKEMLVLADKDQDQMLNYGEFSAIMTASNE